MDNDLQVLLTLAGALFSLIMFMHYNSTHPTVMVRDSILNGTGFVKEILEGHHQVCFNMLRMSKGCFLRLAFELKRRKLLKDTRYVSVKEQLAIFLFIVGRNESNQAMQNRFQHSGETISRHFNVVLHAMTRLAKYYIKPPTEDTPSEIRDDPIFYPFFKDCVGVIDGTHIPAWVRLEDQARYRNRKGFLSQNVMAVVSFDMCFQYVFAGWEGSASDYEVLTDAVWRRPQNRLHIPNGKYYLVDAGYQTTRGFLAPYRGVRYHLKEWSSTNSPSTPSELFNLRHSKLRNVVDRAFNVLKQRFPILQIAPHYPQRSQAKIVVACCVIHNFILKWDEDDLLFLDSTREIWGDEDRSEENVSDEDGSDEESDDEDASGCRTGPSNADKTFMLQFRDTLAQEMWDSQVGH